MASDYNNKDIRVVELKEAVINKNSRHWCKLPYPDHKYGCPNFGKKEECPPKSPLFEKVVKPPFKLVAIKFDLNAHVKKMKERHPDWSDRKLRCLLYWQRKADKKLKEACESITSNDRNSIILYRPESNGINVFETCRRIGLTLEKNPQKIVWRIAIIGNRKPKLITNSE
jgi:predicted metal-binding protein